MSKLGSIVPPPELCRQISGQLSELLNCTVVCKYDESENLFYAQVFNVVFDRFDEVESKVFDYSNANYEQLGAFCIPVMFTPEQTRDCFPGRYDAEEAAPEIKAAKLRTHILSLSNEKEITMRNEDINHPKHYAGYPASIECIDITRHLNFQLGNAVKYIWRAGKKGGLGKEIEDLKKAEWYLGDRRNAPGPGGNEGVARLIFSLIPRRAFDSPLRHSLIEDVLYGRFDEACESLEAWIAKAEKEAENANH